MRCQVYPLMTQTWYNVLYLAPIPLYFCAAFVNMELIIYLKWKINSLPSHTYINGYIVHMWNSIWNNKVYCWDPLHLESASACSSCHCSQLLKNTYRVTQKKTEITKSLITPEMLFSLKQKLSWIMYNLCSQHLQSLKSVQQKLFVLQTLKDMFQMRPLALKADLDLPWSPHSSDLNSPDFYL